jgi:anaerobic selenocysteine-containing dehydrogenase
MRTDVPTLETGPPGHQVMGRPIPGEAVLGGIAPHRISPASWARALRSVWSNRDRLGYSWRILSRGVCEVCCLGPRGLRDDVLPGPHLCSRRLEGLRRNTMGPLDPLWLASIDMLRARSAQELEELGRLPHPLVRRRNERGFSKISWQEALELGGAALASAAPERTRLLASRSGPTDEAWYALARVAELLGAPAPQMVGMSPAGCTATCSLSDWIGTDLLLVWGAELTQQQPEALRYLAAAKEAGTRIVVVNPSSEHALGSPVGLRLADDLVQVRPGGDEALVRAVLKLLVRWGALDQAFVAQRTTGWEALQASLSPLSLDGLLEQAGVRYNEAEWLARLVARASSMISVWSSGLARPSAAGAVLDLHLARGATGRPRTGWMALEAHPGAPGARLCGLRPYVPEALALDVVLTVGALPPELASSAGSIRTRIHTDIALEPTALLEPAEGGLVLLLPALTRHEQPGGGVVMSVERRIRYTPRVSDEPPVVSEARPDALVLAQLASAALVQVQPGQVGSGQGALPWLDLHAARAEMAARPEYSGASELHRDGEFVQWGGPRLDGQELLAFSPPISP